jgi:hypothetical protein
MVSTHEDGFVLNSELNSGFSNHSGIVDRPHARIAAILVDLVRCGLETDFNLFTPHELHTGFNDESIRGAYG